MDCVRQLSGDMRTTDYLKNCEIPEKEQGLQVCISEFMFDTSLFENKYKRDSTIKYVGTQIQLQLRHWALVL